MLSSSLFWKKRLYQWFTLHCLFTDAADDVYVLCMGDESCTVHEKVSCPREKHLHFAQMIEMYLEYYYHLVAEYMVL